MSEHAVTLVHPDTAGRWPVMGDDDADVQYVQLHGEQRLYAGEYSDRTLDVWATGLASWDAAGKDASVYFDNDLDGRAPHDALRLLGRLDRLGG